MRHQVPVAISTIVGDISTIVGNIVHNLRPHRSAIRSSWWFHRADDRNGNVEPWHLPYMPWATGARPLDQSRQFVRLRTASPMTSRGSGRTLRQA